MISSILEFFFSNHYLYDSDNIFNLRIKKAKVLNKLENLELADKRLKKALFYYGLEVLDKTSIAMQPVAIVFGNIYFREEGRLIPAEIEIDNGIKGNVYVAIINNQTVVTLKLFPISVSNQEIYDNIYKHDGTELKGLFDGSNKRLELSDKKRQNIIVDLDINDAEFLNQYPAPLLKNNPYSSNGNGVSDADMLWINKDLQNKKVEDKISYKAIPQDLKPIIGEKEFVINIGDNIWVPYPDGPKQKKIVKLYKNETTGNFVLEFDKTLKPLELKKDMNFIISPNMKTENYKRLYDAFGLEYGTPLNFQGPILKFQPYFLIKGRKGLGIIISPRNYF